MIIETGYTANGMRIMQYQEVETCVQCKQQKDISEFDKGEFGCCNECTREILMEADDTPRTDYSLSLSGKGMSEANPLLEQFYNSENKEE